MRAPWFRCDARIGEDPHVSKLQSDSARWSWILTLGKAKFERPQGSFQSQEHLQASLGRWGKYVPQLLAAGLLRLQADGQVIVASWAAWQSELDYSTGRVVHFRKRQKDETA